MPECNDDRHVYVLIAGRAGRYGCQCQRTNVHVEDWSVPGREVAPTPLAEPLSEDATSG